MSAELAGVTAQAQRLASSGDLAGAHRLLGGALAAVDPEPARASTTVADAAGLQARVLVALGEPQGARSWAAFAYAAHRRLYGPGDERSVVATATLAATLHRLGNDARAATLYRDVVHQLAALDGPGSARVLAAQADLATVEHARGDCAAARSRLSDASERHQAAYGDRDLAGIKMLARLGAMHRDCGDFAEAHRQFRQARQLCTEQFGAGHPMVAQIAALARAPADPAHVCRSAGALADADPGDLTGRPGGRGVPRAAPTATRTSGPADPALADTRRYATAAPVPAPAGDRGDLDDDDLEPWWPPDPPAAPSRPPATDVSERVGIPRPRDEDHPGAIEVRRAGQVPVPLYRPPAADRSRRPGLLVAAAAAVVALGTAVVALGVATWGNDPPSRAGASSATVAGPGPAGSPRATPGTPRASGGPAPGAPSDVTIRDQRDSVTLAWTYPRGSDGPVIIAGARSGQQLQAFQELPSGSDTYVVYGLNERADYCFRISVVYAANRVASAEPVCTRRTP